MVDYVNFSTRYQLPSGFGRVKINDAYAYNAWQKASLGAYQGNSSGFGLPLFNFGYPTYGFGMNFSAWGFGYPAYGCNFTNSLMLGTVIGQTIGYGVKAIKQLFSKNV